MSLYDKEGHGLHVVDAFMQKLQNLFEDPTKARKADARVRQSSKGRDQGLNIFRNFVAWSLMLEVGQSTCYLPILRWVKQGMYYNCLPISSVTGTS